MDTWFYFQSKLGGNSKEYAHQLYLAPGRIPVITCRDDKPEPQAASGKAYSLSPSREKLGGGNFCLLHLCLGQLPEVFLFAHLKTDFLFLLCPIGLMKPEPCWVLVVEHLKVCSSGGCLKRWRTRCVDKLIEGRRWNLGFIVGPSQKEKEKTGEMHTGFWPIDRIIAPTCRLIRSHTFRQQLVKYSNTFQRLGNGCFCQLPLH